MAKFPTTPNFQGLFAPCRLEAELRDLEVEGTVPADLDGVFYRVAPDPQFPPLLGDDIWFNGDGMVAMFDFQAGRVDFRQRWVHTDKFQLERAAGRALFGAYRNPLTDDPAVHGRIRARSDDAAYRGLCHRSRWAFDTSDLDPSAVLLDGARLRSHPRLHSVPHRAHRR
jgi:carotenoid cleavage dioxygenase-like enzyme